jgi:hypothetical protein
MTSGSGDDALADEMSEESFPTSDPPSTWAGPDEPTGDSAPESDPESDPDGEPGAD